MAIFETTMLFLGSIIGAGFATGAEIITFFGNWQIPVGLTATIVGIGIFGMITLEIFLFYPRAEQTMDKSSPKTSKTLHIGIVIIYLILYTAMTAGITQITNHWFCLISLFCSATFALSGIQKMTRLNTIIVATIIVLIISTTLPRLANFIDTKAINWKHTMPTIYWAIMYAGLNCFMFPELIIANAKRHKRNTLLWAGLITAIFVTFLLTIILITIKTTHTETDPMPLLSAVPTPITTVIILLAILTSQYTALFAIIKRTQKIFPVTKNKPCVTTACICLIAFIASFYGFTHIIQHGYPLIGAFTCFYLLFAFWKQPWRVSHQ